MVELESTTSRFRSEYSTKLSYILIMAPADVLEPSSVDFQSTALPSKLDGDLFDDVIISTSRNFRRDFIYYGIIFKQPFIGNNVLASTQRPKGILELPDRFELPSTAYHAVALPIKLRKLLELHDEVESPTPALRRRCSAN